MTNEIFFRQFSFLEKNIEVQKTKAKKKYLKKKYSILFFLASDD